MSKEGDIGRWSMRGLEVGAAQNAGGVKKPGIEDGWFGSRKHTKQGNSPRQCKQSQQAVQNNTVQSQNPFLCPSHWEPKAKGYCRPEPPVSPFLSCEMELTLQLTKLRQCLDTAYLILWR